MPPDTSNQIVKLIWRSFLRVRSHFASLGARVDTCLQPVDSKTWLPPGLQDTSMVPASCRISLVLSEPTHDPLGFSFLIDGKQEYKQHDF